MDANIQIQIFKQVSARWVTNQLTDLLGDGFISKFAMPIVNELVENYSESPEVDKFLKIFIDKDGKFKADKLLDKYIESFSGDGIRFKWGDIFEQGKYIDKFTGNKINVITSDDIKQLKDSFITQVRNYKPEE